MDVEIIRHEQNTGVAGFGVNEDVCEFRSNETPFYAGMVERSGGGMMNHQMTFGLDTTR